MIRFNREVWTVFYWHGGIYKHVWWPSLRYLLYLVLLFWVQSSMGFQVVCLGKQNLGAIVHFLVFLLVFRLHSVSDRHTKGAHAFLTLFGELESILAGFIPNVPGPKPGETDEALRRRHSELATLAKVNCVRLTLAFAVAFVIHCNIMDSMELQGELESEPLHEIVFLHHRLRSLLYAEELDVVDAALSISCEPGEACADGASFGDVAGWWELCKRFVGAASDDNNSEEGMHYRARLAGTDMTESVFRAEVSRRRPKLAHSASRSQPLLGRKTYACLPSGVGAAQDEDDVVTAPLPKVITAMLVNALRVPLKQPWGYPERMLNVIAGHGKTLTDKMADIAAIVTLPTPLPYIQLCQLLSAAFALFYPVSIDIRSGFLDNVLMPFVIYFVILGFEALAKMMESPAGHDSTDLCCLEMIHNLEVHAKYVFDVAEVHSPKLQHALMRPLRSFSFSSAEDLPKEARRDKSLRSFESYFQWAPIPTIVMQDLYSAHGNIDVLVLAARCRGTSLRQLIRMAFNRGRESLKNVEGRDHVPLALEALRKDPNIFCSFVTFLGVDPPPASQPNHDCAWFGRVSAEAANRAAWKLQASSVLENHSALSLVNAAGEADTERSVLGFGSSAAHPAGAEPYFSGRPLSCRNSARCLVSSR